MRRPLLIVVALPIVAAGALAAVVIASGEDPQRTSGGGGGARGTEVVERRTLVDSATVDGTLGYGGSRPALDRRGGTLTWLPRSGSVIRPGERIFEVDGDPVILMNGSTPAWRTLTVGDEGADVLQLERNLAALGHDPGTVDDDYTSATAAAVRAWQEDWGMAETGRVALGDVVFLPGARRVSKLTGTLGESGGGNQGASWDGGGGLQTAFADWDGAAPAARTVADETTPTTETTPPATTPTTPQTTPTTPPTQATTPQTQATTPRTTQTEPPAQTQPRTTPSETTPRAQPSGGDGGDGGGDGAPSGSGDGGGDGGDGGGGSNPGTEVLQTTATKRVVTADVDAADQTLARVGARATVELPGGTRLAGRIVKVGTVATGGSGDDGGGDPGAEGDADPTVPVTIELRSERGAGRLDQAPVIVELARETRRDVLAVPVTALIARPGGGYAVSVVKGTTRRELPVQPGLFADGYVELTGGGVRAGDRVAVPR